MSTTPEPAGGETDFNAIAAQLRHFTKDTNYIQAHWEEWKEKYPDHYVPGLRRKAHQRFDRPEGGDPPG